MNTSYVSPETAQDASILEVTLIKAAKEYLQDSILKALESDIHQVATDAVKQWIEFRIAEAPDQRMMDTNINIIFMEKIVKIVMKDNPIKITVQEKTQNV